MIISLQKRINVKVRIKYGLALIIFLLGLFVVSEYFLAENIQIKRFVKLLKSDKGQHVYIGKKLTNSSKEIIHSLLNINESIAPYSHRSAFEPIYISVRGDKNYLKFRLYKSLLAKGYINDEYWTYLFDMEEKKYFYLGQIHTIAFMNEKDRLKLKKQKERLKELKKIQKNKLEDSKVTLVISFMFLLVFILVYDGLFRQNHFKLKTKKRYWIPFQLLFGVFIFFMMKEFLDNKTLFMGTFMMVIIIVKNIVTLFFCEECKHLSKKKNLFVKEFTCTSCLEKNSGKEKDFKR